MDVAVDGDGTMGAAMTTSRVEQLGELQRRLLRRASEDVLRVEFFSSVMDVVLEFCDCASASLLVRDGQGFTRWEARGGSKARVRIASGQGPWFDSWGLRDWSFDELCCSVLLDRAPTARGERTDRGSYRDPSWPMGGDGHVVPVAVVPLRSEGAMPLGVLGLCGAEPGGFDDETVRFFEAVADAVTVVLTHQRVQWALRERVKELTCLYGISLVAEDARISDAEALQRIVELLPPGWQYPEITSAAIVFEGEVVALSGTREGCARQEAAISMHGARCGHVEVIYAEERPEFDEGPFLREERNLIGEVALQVGAMLERRQAERIREQLRHTDRLATIGRLAAGAAHELNEPLGAILGFAQLANKHPQLPVEVGQDLDRIVKASLHAREVIRQLMFFARQSPPQMTPMALPTAVREALMLVRGRLERRGIRVQRRFARSLPKIVADPQQLQQVVVNLVVNAVQAMPEGGTLTIATENLKSRVKLTVSDTGVGMSEEMSRQVFMPFFTTKDVGQGTGLGLSVVHGIVTAHGGTIRVESQEGKGTEFEILLPTGKRRAAKRARKTEGQHGD
ncbi:MAG: ATP-binding protein [Myxococcota bacterium]